MESKSNRITKKKMRKGGRNLVLLGISAVLIASITTGVSLAIYHKSGDIYLDRSRPGFLPDEEEIEEETKEDEEFDFKETTTLSEESLEEYLKELEEEIEAIDAYKEPFSGKILSNDELGIPQSE